MKWAIAIIGLVSIVGCKFDAFGPQTVGSGTIKTETRTVGSFDTVVTNGSPDVEIAIGKDVSVEVTADDNIVPLVTTEVKGNDLVISSKGSYSTQKGIRIKITTPTLKHVEISGSGDIRATGVSADSFYVRVNGSGDIAVSGTADKVEADCNGSGDIDLSNLKAKSGDASVHGSGNIDLNVSDDLDASIFGSGNISYQGSPKVSKNVNGSGEVRGSKG